MKRLDHPLRWASLALLALITALSMPSVTSAGDAWPQFRGPASNGHADPNADPPLTWSETENVVWKTRVPGRAWSSAVVMDGRVWMNNASVDGLKISVVCLDLAAGEVLIDRVVFPNDKIEQDMHALNSFASPTPVLEPGRVYTHLGTYGVACLDSNTGETIWMRRDIHCDHFRGPGSSPILAGDLLILSMDGIDVQYMMALDKQTGQTVWRTDRSVEFGQLDGDLRKAYSTPLLIETDRGQQLISAGAQAAYSYDPKTGRELWRVRYSGNGYSNVVQPLFDGKLVYVNAGFGKTEMLAVRPDGTGDVTGTHVVWSQAKSMPQKPTPVMTDGLMIGVADRGIAFCVDTTDGSLLWQERIGGGEYSSSPLLAAGRVYLSSHQGRTVILRASREFEVLAENELDSDIMASPAVIGDALIVRTKDYVYRIEDK